MKEKITPYLNNKSFYKNYKKGRNCINMNRMFKNKIYIIATALYEKVFLKKG